eukprot:4481927-Heterocapsa_arctica.AAC.3
MDNSVNAIYDMDKLAKHGWTPWKSLLEWLRVPKFGDRPSPRKFWNIIMETKHKHMFYHSRMVKHSESAKMTVIKLAPENGIVPNSKERDYPTASPKYNDRGACIPLSEPSSKNAAAAPEWSTSSQQQPHYLQAQNPFGNMVPEIDQSKLLQQ